MYYFYLNNTTSQAREKQKTVEIDGFECVLRKFFTAND